MAVEPQVQQFIDFIRDEMPRRIKTNPNSLPDAEKLLVSVSGTLEVIYKTLAELDIAIKSDVDSELSNKEPSITAGTNTQYWRGDKTFQTLNTDAVPETVSRVYLSPEQKTVATQAASDTVNGYLSSADWSTFNGKQNALSDVITADTYGSSTQYPVITFNTKGIATGVTLQTVPTPTFTDATFSVQKNGSPAIAASWNLTALTASVVHTYPDKAIHFGNLSFIATTNSNNLSGTNCHILGGSGNTVSGTDNVVVTGSNNTLSASGQVVLTGDFITEVTWNRAVITATTAGAADDRKTVSVTTALSGTTFWGFYLNEACTTGGTYSATTVPKSYLSIYTTVDGSQTYYTIGIHTLTIIGRTANTGGSSVNSNFRFAGKRRVVVIYSAGTTTVDITTEGTDYNPQGVVTMNITNDAGKLKIAPVFTNEVADETSSTWNVLVESVYTIL